MSLVNIKKLKGLKVNKKLHKIRFYTPFNTGYLSVSELEQEIDTFKKENTKIVSLKKKLTDEKQRLTKEWEEFDKVLGASEITANQYCNYGHLYWEGCMICRVYLR